MTRNKLLLAGGLAMFSALLTIPWFILAFFLAENRTLPVKAAEAAMLVLSTVLGVYLLVTLQRLLNRRYAFFEANRPLQLIIKINIVTAAVTILGFAVPALEAGLAVFGLIVVVALGGLQIYFGMRLLRFPETLQGLHKPYCYLNIATGICLASLILLPLGVLSGAVADVMLGTIFFQAATAGQEPPAS